MPSNRRSWLLHTFAALAASSAALSPFNAHAQVSVTRILVGFPAGGGTDAIARILGERLQAELGSSVVVENKAGAGGQLAAQALKAAAPDGHTLFLSHDHSVSILPLTMKTPGFDPARDFVPVAGFATFVNAVALSGGTPARDFKAWIDGVKAAGGKATMGIPAPASTPQFAVQVIGQRFGLDLVAAPYRGSAPMMADMLGNTIPAGTPKAALDKLAAGLQKVIAQPDVKEKLTAMGLTVGYMSGAELGKREVAYRGVWAKIIKDSGYQPQ